jgi:hypothetical protein
VHAGAGEHTDSPHPGGLRVAARRAGSDQLRDAWDTWLIGSRRNDLAAVDEALADLLPPARQVRERSSRSGSEGVSRARRAMTPGPWDPPDRHAGRRPRRRAAARDPHAPVGAVRRAVHQRIGRRPRDHGTGSIVDALSTGLQTVAWVVLWVPINLLIYDLWYYRRDRRVYRRLRDLALRVVPQRPAEAGAGSGPKARADERGE